MSIFGVSTNVGELTDPNCAKALRERKGFRQEVIEHDEAQTRAVFMSILI